MPISKYYGGHGDEVMSSMTKTYGSKKGKQVFYALANKSNDPMAHLHKKLAKKKKHLHLGKLPSGMNYGGKGGQ